MSPYGSVLSYELVTSQPNRLINLIWPECRTWFIGPCLHTPRAPLPIFVYDFASFLYVHQFSSILYSRTCCCGLWAGGRIFAGRKYTATRSRFGEYLSAGRKFRRRFRHFETGVQFDILLWVHRRGSRRGGGGGARSGAHSWDGGTRAEGAGSFVPRAERRDTGVP